MPSSLEVGTNPPASNFGGLPYVPKITHRSRPNGNLILLLSTPTISLASEPRPLPPRGLWTTSQFHLANRYKSRRLHLMARPHLRQNLKMLSSFHGFTTRPPYPSKKRFLLHQNQGSNRHTVPRHHQPNTRCQIIGYIYTSRSHKQALHIWYGPLSSLLP